MRRVDSRLNEEARQFIEQSALARPYEAYDTAAFESTRNPNLQSSSLDHGQITMNSTIPRWNFMVDKTTTPLATLRVTACRTRWLLLVAEACLGRSLVDVRASV